MRVLDTDLISILMIGPPVERSRLMERLKKDSDHSLAATIVSFEEQVRGWMAAIAKAKTPHEQVHGYARLRSLLEDYRSFTLLDFDERAADQFAQLRRMYRRHGMFDLKIAAIAITAGITLLTRNLRDFGDIEGLSVMNPFAT